MKDENQDGTQAIRRAAAILKQIAHVSGDAPMNLRNISEAVGLPRSTTHRILKSLTDTGLAAYNPASRKYEVGMLSYELGLAVSDRVLELAPWTACVDRVAERSNVTTYLMRRSGFEAVCVHKAEGRAVIRVIPVEVGQRRYLGVGAGATALLAGLPDDTAERVIATIAPELDVFESLDADTVREAVAETRATGFSESRGRAYRSIYGLGMGVRAFAEEPDLAISIAVHTEEVDDARIATWKSIIREEIEATRTRIAAR
ncbi:MAG: IclR family transcriptional regulator [Maritimibacter harenae]|jgi:DNA-binding IclR family transcriptional regulator|uniref:Helix-turn-helix domain-containing protein n=1 Tax=Maritimibacter harenae TaxID=2606218 RepID=A0A845LXK9_9RHOB|nr:IclR family transcriptional regulator [Maritimibacter harenae]MZR11482.1 helix-turn-helix domain-containing protein [Maritimibacter harenae]